MPSVGHTLSPQQITLACRSVTPDRAHTVNQWMLLLLLPASGHVQHSKNHYLLDAPRHPPKLHFIDYGGRLMGLCWSFRSTIHKQGSLFHELLYTEEAGGQLLLMPYQVPIINYGAVHFSQRRGLQCRGLTLPHSAQL